MDNDDETTVQDLIDDGVVLVDGKVTINGMLRLARVPIPDYNLVWLAFNGFQPSATDSAVRWHGTLRFRLGKDVVCTSLVAQRSDTGWHVVCQCRGQLAASDDKFVGVAVNNALRGATSTESDIPVNPEHVALVGFQSWPMWALLKAKTDKR